MAFEKPGVVIENGSYVMKAGFACDNHPVAIFRNMVARPKYLNGKVGKQPYDVYIGDEAMGRMEDYDLNTPVVKGKVVNWDNIERIWHHIYYRELKVAPEERAVILAASPTTSMDDKYKYCEIMFENLNAPAVCVQPQCVLALYGSGCTTGVAVDLGYDTVDINPVYQGGTIGFAHIRTCSAGGEMSEFLTECLNSRGINLGYENDRIIEQIIKKCCYVSRDASISVVKKKSERKYKLPSGEVVDVSEEAFIAPELLFQPSLVKGVAASELSLTDAVVTSVFRCDSDLRPEMYDAVVTAGGLANLPGLNDRLGAEIEQKARIPVRILGSEEADVVSWLGGAVFAGMPEAHTVWVTKQQFQDQGMKTIRKKFL